MSLIITLQTAGELFSPPTLQEICRFYCSSNARTVLLIPPKRNQHEDGGIENSKLQKYVQLPVQIWQDLLDDYHGAPNDYLPLMMAVIRSRKNIGLNRIHLPNTPTLTDERLRSVMANYPFSLDIHNCPTLTKKAVTIINEYGHNLECLRIGNSTHILPMDVDTWISKLSKETPQGLRKIVRSIANFFNSKLLPVEDGKIHGLLATPKLRKLVVWGLHVKQSQQLRLKNLTSSQENIGGGDLDATIVNVDYWEYLTRDFIHQLQHLDLSSCQEITDLSFLLEAKDNLKALYLHDVLLDYDEKTWGILKHLEGLRFLDVSQYNELASVFPNPDTILDSIVTALPHLVGLDISGTNLAGFEPDGLVSCGIMGLKSRKETPLKFLGLLTTHYNASCRRTIPAINIAGGKNVEHLLTALQIYSQRENTIKKVIRMLYEKLQEIDGDNFLPSHTILSLLVQAMKNHELDKHTQIVAMAAMFHVIKRIYNGPTKCLNKVERDEVLNCISKAMRIHLYDLSLLRNGMLNLLFLCPYMNMSSDLIPLLTDIGKVSTADPFLMKAVAYIIHNVTRSLSKTEKEKLGNLHIVEKSLSIVDELITNVALDQMTIFWTLLWNITDDMPSNFDRFVKAKGIDICFRFIRMCLDLFNSAATYNANLAILLESQIPMFALLSNLLQNHEFEAQIITSEQITDAVELLEKDDSAGYEKLSFHVCGFLCKVASKKICHSLQAPTRHEILDKIFQTVTRLDYKKQFDYQFRHLTPLSALLEVKDAPEIHLWVLWTLVNLTETNPNKYIKLIAADKLIKIRALSKRFRVPIDHKCSSEINRLCQILAENIGFRLKPDSQSQS